MKWLAAITRRIHTSWVVWYAIGMLILFSWALVWPGFFRVHDYTHVARLVEMERALDAGHFPVHWSLNFGYGYGMPLFLFYGPLPFYLATVIMQLGFPPLAAIQTLMVLSGVVAWVGMYLAGKRWGTAAGLAAASVFLAAPYRAVDIYVRGAFNEAWAMSFLPWLVYGAMLISERRYRTGIALLSAAVAAVILTHNLTAVMAFPFLGLLSLVWILTRTSIRRWQKLAHPIAALVTSYTLGIALSLFYSVPAFLEKGYTQIEAILGGYFDFRLHFLYIRQLLRPAWDYGGSGPGPDDGISFHLGAPIFLAAVIVSLSWLYTLLTSLAQRHFPEQKWWRTQLVPATLVTLLAAACFLTLFHSQPIWEAISVMSFFQFPWRFLAVISTLAAFLVAVAIGSVPVKPIRWILLAVITSMVLVGQWRFHRPESFLQQPDDFYYRDAQRIRTNMSDILPDYISNTFQQDELEPLPMDTPRIVVSPDGDSTEPPRLEINDPQQLLLLGSFPAGATITWNIADFPGWTYSVDDRAVSPELLPDGRRSMTLTQPAQAIGARFTMTPIRQWTGVISSIAFVIWLSLWIPRRYERKKHR